VPPLRGLSGRTGQDREAPGLKSHGPVGITFTAICGQIPFGHIDHVLEPFAFVDAMNRGHPAVTWLSTVGIGSIRVRRFARGWRPSNGGWDEVGRR
jgi:hypothetical protein